jgi:hypothetical protein
MDIGYFLSQNSCEEARVNNIVQSLPPGAIKRQQIDSILVRTVNSTSDYTHGLCIAVTPRALALISNDKSLAERDVESTPNEDPKDF